MAALEKTGPNDAVCVVWAISFAFVYFIFLFSFFIVFFFLNKS